MYSYIQYIAIAWLSPPINLVRLHVVAHAQYIQHTLRNLTKFEKGTSDKKSLPVAMFYSEVKTVVGKLYSKLAF